MKPFKHPLLRAFVAPLIAFMAILGAGIGGAAFAAGGPLFRADQVMTHGYANATPAQTFATTSYADLALATVTVPKSAVRAFNQTEAPGTPTRSAFIRVFWSASVSKATATDGRCAIYVNGAIVTATERGATSAAAYSSIGGFFSVARSSDAAQTVKLQCKSGDTNVFTVNYATILVEEVIR